MRSNALINVTSGRLRLAVFGALALACAPAGAQWATVRERVQQTTYEHNTSAWVLGQVRMRSTHDPVTGGVFGIARTDYEPTTALPVRVYNNVHLQETRTYNADGTPSTISDGRDSAGFDTTTAYADWKRGVPQRITFADGTSRLATVDDAGLIRTVTDETGAKTCYDYDAMGRVSRITHPSETQPGTCDTSAWHATTVTFAPAGQALFGIGADHWMRTEDTGGHRKVTHYDALLRPIVVEDIDVDAMADTHRWTAMRYDAAGRQVFASYPRNLFQTGWVDWDTVTGGTRTTYDAIGRVTRVEQDSELGVLATTTEHLDGFQTRVTAPRGTQTLTRYIAWDQPTTDLPGLITQAGQVTEIRRDAVGKPMRITRRDASGALSVDRTFVYDGEGRLCRTSEPETGNTVTGYDVMGNLAWQATGVTLQANDCDHVVAYYQGRTTTREYDTRGRLRAVALPDGRGNQAWSYWPDGQPHRVTTYNATGNGAPVVNTYAHSARRLLTAETLEHDDGTRWTQSYGYDRHGHLAALTTPKGTALQYAPNALGQPTQVRDTDGATYASDLAYYPNGTLRAFRYGNGIVHAMTQNARQFPARVTHGGGAMDYAYTYDAHANPTHIVDHVRGSTFDRTLAYDSLDRLTEATSCSFGGDCKHRFAYDVLDNLKSWTLAGVKDYAHYHYDPGTNRLANVQNSAGASVVGLGYDAQGNLTNKNGQLYAFDYGNRLRSVHGKEAYRYDAHGRRTQADRAAHGRSVFSMYTQDGQLAHQRDDIRGEDRDYVHLAGSLLATVAHRHSDGAVTTTFQHTDALGSPVAISDAAGNVIERLAYEPFGAVIGKPGHDGVGFAGHVMDGGTGLVQMQQRSQDKELGRFLTGDEASVDFVTGSNFNRYSYANNNPYRFADPDGRFAIQIVGGIAGALIGGGGSYLSGNSTKTVIRDTLIGFGVGTLSTIPGGGALAVGIRSGLASAAGDASSQALENGVKNIDSARTLKAGVLGMAVGGAAKGVADRMVPNKNIPGLPQSHPLVREGRAIAQSGSETRAGPIRNATEVATAGGTGAAVTGAQILVQDRKEQK